MADVFDQVVAEDVFDRVAKSSSKQGMRIPFQEQFRKTAKKIVPIIRPVAQRQPIPTGSEAAAAAGMTQQPARGMAENLTGPRTIEAATRMLSPMLGQFGVQRQFFLDWVLS